MKALSAALPRASEETFRLLVESVKDYAIYMLDTEGRVATWNSGAARIKGYSADEILGAHFSIFYPKEDVEAGKCEAELAAAVNNGHFEDEDWRIRKNGTRFWANVVITPLRDPAGRLTGFAKVTRDLTERRAAEAERLRLVRAHEALRLRDEFLSIASHELKTPLAALNLQLESLRGYAEAIGGKALSRTESALRSVRRLLDLVNSLLDVSRISTGQLTLHPEPFDLAEVVRDVVEGFSDSAAAAKCSVSIEGESDVHGIWDRLRVEQALMNLLSNAVKYGAGGAVTVVLSTQGDEAVLEVRDQGPGISKEDAERIFDPFERAASMRNYGGLGLGLYVTSQIAEAHGGSIAALDTGRHGARLALRLPLHASRTEELA
jgi:PAS domain S-box-containing protein